MEFYSFLLFIRQPTIEYITIFTVRTAMPSQIKALMHQFFFSYSGLSVVLVVFGCPILALVWSHHSNWRLSLYTKLKIGGPTAQKGINIPKNANTLDTSSASTIFDRADLIMVPIGLVISPKMKAIYGRTIVPGWVNAIKTLLIMTLISATTAKVISLRPT